MSTLLALSRPTEWNFPLFVHVLGAMILMGGLLTGASTLAFARGDVRFLRLGYWTLLAVALPGYIVMRIGAEWIYAEEPWGELPEGVDEPAWIGIGYIVADAGALLTLIALILGGIGVRRLRSGGGQGLLKATMVIALIVLAAAVVAIWAMAGKPD
jgi:ABC-type maltose transport system permease subunit